MVESQCVGIIDIGSNSVRLVIYEITNKDAYRIVDEYKNSVRLSAKIDSNGDLPTSAIDQLATVLTQYKELSTAHQVICMRAVATAAIRNARNHDEIILQLKSSTGLDIEVLSGEEEARLGFLGMINAMDISDGILVDIGGGSTEITLFRNRNRVRSVSFSFGAVNTAQRFASKGQLDQELTEQVREMVDQAIHKEPWIYGCAEGLPLIGVGGTMRTLAKVNQRLRKDLLSLTHNYEISVEDMETLSSWLLSHTPEQRKKIDGISKDRADIIGFGLMILQSIFQLASCSHYITSGYGLRDGLLFETIRPSSPFIDQVLMQSVHNILGFHPSVPSKHIQHVRFLAEKLFIQFGSIHGYGKRELTLLHTAALLYRIGTTVNYDRYPLHTFYLIIHSRLNGLTHREIILCAAIASYSKKHTPQLLSKYMNMLYENDLELIAKLGSLLKLAIALDRSETQRIYDVQSIVHDKELLLTLICNTGKADLEIQEIISLSNDFKKIWRLQVRPLLQNE